MELKISIHDLEIIQKALRCYLQTNPEYQYPYNKDLARSLTIQIHGLVEYYNYKAKNPDEEE